MNGMHQSLAPAQTVASPRVLLVEDSAVELAIIRTILEDNGICVVGTATNGAEALAKIPSLNPDVICTDYHMPVMDGMVLTQEVMARYPRPILVLSISAQPYQVHNILNILQAGALDVMAKPMPHLGGVAQTDAQLLVEKIRILSGVRVIAHHTRPGSATLRPPAQTAHTLHTPHTPDQARTAFSAPSPRSTKPWRAAEIVGVGSSTGGPQALLKILSDLPANFALPVVCVQHISAGFLPGFVAWLNDNAQLPVVVAEAGMRPQGGHVYVAPEGQHLVLDAQKRFQLLTPSAHEAQGPSVDRLFQSLAAVYPGACVGLVLSGMGNDGAQGVVAIRQQGGLTLAQDEASSIIFGMPKSAIDTGAVDEIWPLSSLAWRLVQLQNLCATSTPP